MSKIKLLYALESAGGGTLKHVTYLSTRMDQCKFEITVVLPDEEYEKDTKEAILFMRKKGIHVDIIPMAKSISPLKDIQSLFKIYLYLKEKQFDIVHSHSSKAGVLFRIASRLVSVPIIIYTPHCFYFTACSGLKRRWFAGLERILAKITDTIILSGTEKIALEKEHIYPKKTIEVIDNAIDPNDYLITSGKFKEQMNIPMNHTVIIGVGRLVEQKNWDMLIHAARIVLQSNPNISFIIAGDGPCHKHLSGLIEQSGISSDFKLCGYLEDISQLYSIADLFVSTSKWEGLPYTYLEALHFRLPILTTHTEGIEYFIERTGCACIHQNDIESLIRKMQTMATEICTTSKSYAVSPFTIGRFIEQHQIIYHQLFESTKTAKYVTCFIK